MPPVIYFIGTSSSTLTEATFHSSFITSRFHSLKLINLTTQPRIINHRLFTSIPSKKLVMFFCSVRHCRCRKTRLRWPETNCFRPQMHVVVHKHRNWGCQSANGGNTDTVILYIAFSQIRKIIWKWTSTFHLQWLLINFWDRKNKLRYDVKYLAEERNVPSVSHLSSTLLIKYACVLVSAGQTVWSLTHSTDSKTPHLLQLLFGERTHKKKLLLDIKHAKASTGHYSFIRVDFKGLFPQTAPEPPEQFCS